MHEVLSEKDAKKLLVELGTTSRKLPKIFGNDPVVIELKAKVGDTIRITRKSPTAGTTTYYRIVVRV